MLFVNRKLRITNNVDEENVRDLKLDLFLDLCGHRWECPGLVVGLSRFCQAGRDESDPSRRDCRPRRITSPHSFQSVVPSRPDDSTARPLARAEKLGL